jgi:cephalosporin hydroxylase
MESMESDRSLPTMVTNLFNEMARQKYVHPFTWLGRPIIQLPHDIIAMQEIIWRIQPDLIVETGIAHGGTLVFYASLLELLGAGHVVGIDIDIRAHNRVEIDRHPLRKRITMLEGSAIDAGIIEQVYELARNHRRVLVALDSNHTHEHVLKELQAYSPLVRAGSYVVVFDTAIEDMPKEHFSDRPWGPGNNPKTAVHEFLLSTDRFAIDRELESKLLMTVAPDGYLKCIRD